MAQPLDARKLLLALPPELRTARLEADVSAALGELEPLVGASQTVQQEIVEFSDRYERGPRGAPLPARSLRVMREGTRRYVDLQDRLASIAERYEPLAALDDDELSRLAVEPGARLKALSTAVAAGVTLYDNYLALLGILKDDRLRRLLNDPDRGYGIPEDVMWGVVDRLNADEVRARLERTIDAWASARARAGRADDPVEVTLEKVITSSASYRYAAEDVLDEHLPTEWQVRRERFLDSLVEMGQSVVGGISKVFGNGIGLVEVRKGKLYDDAKVHQHLAQVLQPLDLLLEKTPFRLTDAFIPGYFGHAAIWLGTEAELDALDVWRKVGMSDAELAPIRREVAEGQSVLEALRSGVELNTLAHFLNVDDVAVLRPTYLEPDDVIASLGRAFQQYGKAYDFNFDVETTEAIVCSELPYHVYPGMRWETDEQMGRYTISPDAIAKEALKADPSFAMIVLYRDGWLVSPRDHATVLRELIG